MTELEASAVLDPRWSGEGTTWAAAIQWHLRNRAGARERFERVQGRLAGCTPFRISELEAVALCGLGEPDVAVDLLRDALPLFRPGDRGGTRALYDLLSDPPMPGIDRLRRIVDTET
jgi:hypothetical protein